MASPALSNRSQINRRADPWPMAKLERRAAAERTSSRKLAVLLTTGAMNPVHKGHVQMLHQAQERLESEGYTVLGAWLSPSHDRYVQPKSVALGTPGLSADFRLELAHRAVADDDLVSVGSWEAKQSGDWPDFSEVADALQHELRRHKTTASATVFYVCGTDHFRKCGLHIGMRGGVGVVAVPRTEPGKPCTTSARDRPDKLVYFADPASGDVATYSSTKVRQALKDGDDGFACEAISEEAAKLLLRPGPLELATFEAEYQKLGIMEKVTTQASADVDMA